MSLNIIDEQKLRPVLESMFKKWFWAECERVHPGGRNPQKFDGYPNGQDTLMGGLSDSVEGLAVFDDTAKQYIPTQRLVASSTVDNRNGLAGNTTVTLTYQYSDTTSATHTISNAVKAGLAFEFKAKASIFGIGGDATTKFSLDYTWTSTESHTTTETVSHTMSQLVAVNAPKGKVYKAVLTCTVQQLDIPYRANVRISGGCSMQVADYFDDPNQPPANVTADGIGTLFAASGDPKYIATPSGGGFVPAVTGRLSAQRAGDFMVQIWDVTSQFENPVAGATAINADKRTAIFGENLVPQGVTLVSSVPISQAT